MAAGCFFRGLPHFLSGEEDFLFSFFFSLPPPHLPAALGPAVMPAVKLQRSAPAGERREKEKRDDASIRAPLPGTKFPRFALARPDLLRLGRIVGYGAIACAVPRCSRYGGERL